MWLLLLRPRFWGALARDLCNTLAAATFGPTCRVTGEHVYPADRVAHEHHEHPTDGPCVLI